MSATEDYHRLEDEAAKPARALADWTERWNKLQPLSGVNGQLEERISHFASERRITLDSLVALDTRVDLRGKGPDIWLAWAHHAYLGGRDIVTALKFRNIGDGRREALKPSVFVRPIVIGNKDSLDVFIAEGETDTARLYDLVGNDALVLMLPAGARTWKREWENYLPRGATVHLCHDADDSGDAGAAKMAGMVAGRTIRVRPPDGAKDWCDWDGDRQAFLSLVTEERTVDATPTLFLPLSSFLERSYPAPEPLLGSPDSILYLARGTFFLVYGDGGAGKSTLTVDAVAHLAAGQDWLDIPVPRPVKILLVENEGAAGLFQAKLAAKHRDWRTPGSWDDNVMVYAEPWSRFSFADPHMRQEVRNVCYEHKVDLIVANPLFGVGGPGAGKPEETGAFVEWLKELGMWNDGPAVWILHHQNKLGQISGDWIRQPDTVALLEQDGDAPRSLLTWEKVRWTDQTPDGWAKKNMLSWELSHKGYERMDIDLDKVTDSQLTLRLDTYLESHPWESTTTIIEVVKGNAKRLRQLLKEGVETHRYMDRTGSRGATLYALRQDGDTNPVLPLEDGRTAEVLTLHEHRDTTPSYPKDGEPGASIPEGLTPSSVLPIEEDGVEDGRQNEDVPDPDADIPF